MARNPILILLALCAFVSLGSGLRADEEPRSKAEKEKKKHSRKDRKKRTKSKKKAKDHIASIIDAYDDDSVHIKYLQQWVKTWHKKVHASWARAIREVIPPNRQQIAARRPYVINRIKVLKNEMRRVKKTATPEEMAALMDELRRYQGYLNTLTAAVTTPGEATERINFIDDAIQRLRILEAMDDARYKDLIEVTRANIEGAIETEVDRLSNLLSRFEDEEWLNAVGQTWLRDGNVRREFKEALEKRLGELKELKP